MLDNRELRSLIWGQAPGSRGCCRNYSWGGVVQTSQKISTLPKSYLLGGGGTEDNNFDVRISTYEGLKTIEYKVFWIWKDIWLRQLFDLCEFDLVKVDCIVKISTFLMWAPAFSCPCLLACLSAPQSKLWGEGVLPPQSHPIDVGIIVINYSSCIQTW